MTSHSTEYKSPKVHSETKLGANDNEGKNNILSANEQSNKLIVYWRSKRCFFPHYLKVYPDSDWDKTAWPIMELNLKEDKFKLLTREAFPRAR